MRKRCVHGNTLAEYGFIGAIILVASIGIVMVLGQNLQSAMAGLKGDLQSNIGAADSSASSAAAANNGGGGPGGAPPDILSIGSMDFDLGSLNANLPGDIAVSGANGTTDTLASTIQQIAQALLDAGEITEEQAASLVELANQGHKIAQAEALIEQAAAGDFSGDMVFYQNFGGMSVSGDIGGTTWHTNVDVLAGSLASPGTAADYYASGAQPGGQFENVAVGSEITQLQSLLAAAQASGALNNPQVNAAVTSLVNNITAIADGVASHVVAANVGNPPTNPNDIRDGVASTVTHQNSATICGTGGGSDSGSNCSG